MELSHLDVDYQFSLAYKLFKTPSTYEVNSKTSLHEKHS